MPTSARLSLGQYASRVLVTVALGALAVVVWRISDVIVLAFAGLVIAIVLDAIMRPVMRWLPLSRNWALLVAMTALAVVLGLAGWLIGAEVAAELGQLTETLPGAWRKVQEWIMGLPLVQALLGEGGPRGGAGMLRGALGGLAGFTRVTLGALTSLVLVIFLGIIFAADPHVYRRGLVCLAPPSTRARLSEGLDAAGTALRNWLLGQFISMLIIGTVTGLGLWLLGVPMALALGVLAGLLEFIPFIGPIIAAVPAILVAFTVGPQMALYVALLYFVIQQSEGNLVTPMLQRWAAHLPPALAVISVVVFGILFGLLGVLFAVPMMVVAMVLVQKLYVESALERR